MELNSSIQAGARLSVMVRHVGSVVGSFVGLDENILELGESFDCQDGRRVWIDVNEVIGVTLLPDRSF